VESACALAVEQRAVDDRQVRPEIGPPPEHGWHVRKAEQAEGILAEDRLDRGDLRVVAAADQHAPARDLPVLQLGGGRHVAGGPPPLDNRYPIVGPVWFRYCVSTRTSPTRKKPSSSSV